MIRPANFFVDELKSKVREAYLEDPDVFLWHRIGPSSEWEVEHDLDSDWSRISKVSLNEGKVRGFFSAGVDRDLRVITGLDAMLLERSQSPGFLLDLRSFVKSLTLHYSVVRFFAVAGGPPEELWRKAVVESLGGKEVGRFTNYARLADETVHDVVWFEIPGVKA